MMMRRMREVEEVAEGGADKAQVEAYTEQR